jgi:hypothetical protein
MADSDFFEIDFLAVETAKSGDAITIRYQLEGYTYIHVVDGGFTETGESVVKHIDTYYGDYAFIDHVVLTHSDRDHALGLMHVLEHGNVGTLWMNRPWLYAEELIHRFPTYNSVDRLRSRLRSCYPSLTQLEEIAAERGIAIREVFQGQHVGAFTVMSPSRSTYLDLIVESEKTPEGIEDFEKSVTQIVSETVRNATYAVRGFFAALWGQEVFSPQETSAENEMSVVQFAQLNNMKILLTGDTGRRGLAAVIEYAPYVGLQLPGIDRFQVPHHGSRRNVNSPLLDAILGPRYANQYDATQSFQAFISSAEADPDHPRKSVERAMHHRGGVVYATEGINLWTQAKAPARGSYSDANQRTYPTDQEE